MRQPISFPAWINPEIVPGLPFRWYGLSYLIAFAIVYLLFRLQLKQKDIAASKDDISGFFLWGSIGLLVGARLFAALVYDKSHGYWAEPWLIFWPFDKAGRFTGFQDLSYHGGAIGLSLAAWLYARAKKIDFLCWGDMVAAAVPLGYVFGRLGNFINGELYGRVTTSPLGIVFPSAETFSAKEAWVQDIASKTGISINSMNDMLNLPRHPSQLYEALFEGIVLGLFLLFAAFKFKPFKGFIIASYVTGYGLIRFFVEYYRMPDPEWGFILALGDKTQPYYLPGSMLDFSLGQALCFIMVILGISLFILFKAKAKKVRDTPRAAHGT